jgi:16S rRNA (adenine1518-N6/adenine1519-N6)-dimethyltransferase
LNLTQVRKTLAELDLHPSKSLGQNFIYSTSTIEKIVRLARLDQSDQVLEIGPGLGALSNVLIGEVKHLTVAEVDNRLADYLERSWVDQSDRVTVINQDFLKLSSLSDNIQVCVGNLPYSQAVPMILTLFERFPQIQRGLFLVQKEEAERLTAHVGTKLYGIPTLKLQYFGTAKIVGKVSRRVFYPEPNVDSVLLEVRRTITATATLSYKTFSNLINLSFKHRRKTLVNNLKTQFPNVLNLLADLEIPVQVRAEDLSFEQYLTLGENASL